MVDTNYAKEMKDNLNKLIGKSCWYVIGGKGVGSHVDIGIGGKIPQKKTLKNNFLSDDEKKFESEYSFFIRDASWRLRKNEQVLCSWVTPPLSNNKSPLTLIAGFKISSINFDEVTFDISIVFDEIYFLDIFCGWKDSDVDISENYLLHTSLGIFFIDGDGGCGFEARDGLI